MTDISIAFIVGILWAINPIIAFGAAIGAIFLINTIEDKYANKKYTFGAMGSLIGYFLALPFTDGDYEFLIALLGSSLSIYIIIAIQRMINEDDGLPLWVKDIVSVLGELVDIIKGGGK